MAEKLKTESKLDYLHRHYEIVGSETDYAEPRKIPKKIQPGYRSYYWKQEEYEKKEAEKKRDTILTRKEKR